MSDEVKQFNVYLPIELIREIKFAAVEREQSLSALVEQAMRDHLRQAARRERDRERKRRTGR